MESKGDLKDRLTAFARRMARGVMYLLLAAICSLSMRASADMEIEHVEVNGVTWAYRVSNGGAEVCCDFAYDFDSYLLFVAIDPLPVGKLAIPSTLDGYPVTSIGDGAFQGCSSLTSLTIPASVTSIGNSVFAGCTRLTSVTIPARVTSIGSCAFEGCPNLRIAVSAGNAIYSSRNGTLRNKSGGSLLAVPSARGDYVIPSGVTRIGDSAFAGCSSLTSITIPAGVISIGSYAFSGCSSLTSLTIPDGVTSIGRYVFEDCSSLTSLTIPASVTGFGDSWFSEGETPLRTVYVEPGDKWRVLGMLEAAEVEVDKITFRELPSLPDGALSVAGFEGVYDGTGKSPECSVKRSYNATVRWQIDGGAWSEEKPVFTDAGSWSVVCRVYVPGYATAIRPVAMVVKPRPVTLTSGSVEELYDGTELTDSEVTVGGDGFVDGEGATFDVTGSQTEAGSSANAFTYTLGDNTKAENYAITVVTGRLTVAKASMGDGEGGKREPGAGALPAGGLSRWDVEVGYDGRGHTVDAAAIAATFAARVDAEPFTVAYAAGDGKGVASGTPPVAAVWAGSPPVYTNAGKYVVWYRVTSTNYEDFVHGARVTVKPRDIANAVVGEIPDIEASENGSPIKPRVALMDGSPNHVTANDYTVGYANNTAAGKARITLTGKNNYTGTKVVTFNILAFLPTPEAPVFTPEDGTVIRGTLTVSIACPTEGAVIRYTTDGSTPNVWSPVYRRFKVDRRTTVKAVAVNARGKVSEVAVAEYALGRCAEPVVDAAETFTGDGGTEVGLTCATEGAEIHYTTDGREPDSSATKYTGPFRVTESCTVKAVAVRSEYFPSPVAVRTITREWPIGEVMGAPGRAFSTDGAAGFHRVVDASAPNGEAMRSGAIGDSAAYGVYSRSILSTVVEGAGRLTFRWRSSCEADDTYEWDHAECAVDGEVVARINGVTAWTTVAVAIAGAGPHTVAWTYLKDEAEAQGEDCVWVAGFAWEPEGGAGGAAQGAEAKVPYAWLREQFPGMGDTPEAYEAKVRETAANGMTVEACYVAGLSATDPEAKFRTAITVVDGRPQVSWEPNLNADGVPRRVYAVWGRASLDSGDWGPVQEGDRFFKVTVSMPTGAD